LEALTHEALVSYHQQWLQPDNAYLIVVGQFDQEQVLAELTQYFGHLPLTEPPAQPSTAQAMLPLATSGRHHVARPGVQATVRLGHLAMPRTHPDFYRMTVVNTILGGYFGSRLMKNIREEKGYTYGIGSAWFSYKHSGAFVIQADTGNEYVEDLIKEVKHEISRLAETGVSPDELNLVKNYLVGRNLSQRETAFQLGDTLRYALFHGMSFAELDRRFAVIEAMQPEEIAPLVQQYLKPEDLLEVVVG
jgi:predicted Zn-dependent peptidase